MKKLTDDEIMAKALLCPESEKVPLEVGDRVIALEDFGNYDIKRGMRGTLIALDDWNMAVPWLIKWEDGATWYAGGTRPIGKLVKRGSV